MKRPFALLLLVSLWLHLAASFFSVGFQHYDEHFQVLEFVAYKEGRAPVQDLAWEFPAKIRPWLQPGLYYGIGRAMDAVGVHAPGYHLAADRLFSSLLGWLTVVVLMLCVPKWIRSEKLRIAAWLSLSLFWFAPFFHARTSSENLSSSFFFLGLGVFLLGRDRIAEWIRWPLVALLWGLSFEMRFQAALMIAFAGLWIWASTRFKLRPLFGMACGFLAIAALGAMVDRWGYGEWTFTPWNYFRVNLIEGAASSWGVSPWWDYLPQLFGMTPPPFAIVIIAACVAFWVLAPTHLLTWSTAPLAFIHFLIAHKELRFLFPIAPVLPLFPVLALQRLQELKGGNTLSRLWNYRAVRAAAWTLLAINCVFALVGALSPAKGQLKIPTYLATHHSESLTLYSTENDPFQHRHFMNFFRPRNYEFHAVRDLKEFTSALATRNDTVWLYHTRSQLPAEMPELSRRCQVEYQAIPAAWKNLNFNGWISRLTDWAVFRCVSR